MAEFQEIQWVNYEITQHAKERYAERIMERDTTADIRAFISKHNQDITEWINKLINYGTLLYTGAIKDHAAVRAFLNDYWCILVDAKVNRVITLYKIDLGDEEVNELFVRKTLDKIAAAKENVYKVSSKTDQDIIDYQDIIQTNNIDIQQLKNKIKSLETINEGDELLIKGAKSSVNEARYEVRTLVEQLIAKRNF